MLREGDGQGVGDSISQSPRVITGTKSFQTAGGTAHKFLTQAEYTSICGRPYDNNRDVISVMNASWKDAGAVVTGAVYNEDDANSIYVFTATSLTNRKWIRVNYAITLGV